MKRKYTKIILCAITALTLVACGNVAEGTEDTSIETEASHEHTYVEEVVTSATCTTDGESIFTCECGDIYTEATPATGHNFSNYVSNEDATYEADGTETATCICGESDTRVAKGSMLTYSFEEMDVTKFAKSTVNVRSLPISDGEKLGDLSMNDEVKVTGKCNETGWYRIEYSNGIAYVSDEYLVDEKVEVQASTPVQSASTECPYPLYTVYEDDTTAWFYCVWDGYNHPGLFGNYWSCANTIERPWNVAHGYNEQASGMMRSEPLDTLYVSNGMPVLKVVFQK